MKKLILGAMLLLLIIPCASIAQNTSGQLNWLTKWFDAWQLMNREVLLLPKDPAPEMLFYDKDNVYTTSVISASGGHSIPGPSLLGEKLSWKMNSHDSTITLPGGQQAPVGLMSFAGPAKDGKGKKFFVMAAPAFWKEAAVKSDELGLENLLTGVFLHEFSHTRQMEGIGSQVEYIEQHNKFEYELTDDIVQDYFKKDSIYVQRFRTETDKFYDAAMADTKKKWFR